ncbi:MAG TPA: DoxX family protein [Terracidiphilus sp.]|jgi:putative oxidoreductase|nr:DoxX family protein [Terracidiphilus sp.]
MTDTTREMHQPAPQPQDAPRQLKFRNSVPDWSIRAVTFLVFLYFGTAKLKSEAGAPWVVFFDQLGFGQWLRYVTGALETAGAFLVLISATVEIGLAILIATMLGAAIVAMFILHDAGEAFVPFALFSGMIAFWLHRRRV